MKWLQWIPMVATLVLIYLLRRSHIGVTNFKFFVLIIIVWSLLLILFFHLTRAARPKKPPGDPLDVGISKED
jgi:hypothetical protein